MRYKMGVREAIDWLIDNDDISELLAADYRIDGDLGLGVFSVTAMFIADCYGLDYADLAKRIRRNIQLRGW